MIFLHANSALFKPLPFSSVINVHIVLLLQVRRDDSSDDLMREVGSVRVCTSNS